ncbi:alpha/beta hydrolase family protein [Agromyces mediolanus]|uniref:alpha/beta hydrolase family protein n=1 Tax=Agromyces mediolanus TaxID=41986 RepID=UPI001E571DC9|nr:alpha/beta family hydrolase [Agromyces mediolanus]MCD1570409.1 dienelactone hydrolase family protein [Agromyces mediolanus]
MTKQEPEQEPEPTETSVAEHELRIDVDGTPVSAVATRPDDALATVVVAHGAGAGMAHPFMSGFTRALTRLGFATLRFNFAYVEAGRRMPGRPAAAIAAWRAAVETARGLAADAGVAEERIWAAGKSYGGRMASMAVAEGMPVDGLVYLGYPLHAPGKAGQLRDAHLYGVTTPMLFLQGTNDPFATPNSELDEVVARIGPTAVLEWLDGAGHSFEVKGRKRAPAEIAAELAPLVADFVRPRLA